MRVLYVVTGMIAATYGAWQILLVYAFSGMVGQDLPDAARDAKQWRTLSGETPTIGFGVILIIVGLGLAFGKSRPRPNPRLQRTRSAGR
jgi:hypothetical protein